MLFILVTVLAVLLAAGIVYEQMARRRERAYALPGRLVDVGGYRLHVTDRGQGGPTVVVIAGAGDCSYSWTAIQREVAKFTRILTYDRAGLGSSDPGPAPHGVRSLIELQQLLDSSGVSAPYILVGHSLGGLLAPLYANRYPEQVAGMVLVDPSHEFLRDDRKFQTGFAVIGVMLRVMKGLSLVGLPRFLGEVLKVMPMYPERASYARQLSPEEYRLWAAAVYRNVAMDGGHNEFGAVSSLVQEAWTQRKPDAEQPQFGDMPLVVLTNPGFGADWAAMHRELAGRSRNSTHHISDQNGHSVQMLRPDLVVDAIRHVVAEARVRTEQRG